MEKRWYVALIYYKQHKFHIEHHIKVSTAKADNAKEALEKAIAVYDKEFADCFGCKRADTSHVIEI